MVFRDELEVVVKAPVEIVWGCFIDFSRWPEWSQQLAKVRPHTQGWCFRLKAYPKVNWVARAVRLEPPTLLEFCGVEQDDHTLELSGTLRLQEVAEGTCVWLEYTARPSHKTLLGHLEDLLSSIFGEPNKIIGEILEEFKREAERRAR